MLHAIRTPRHLETTLHSAKKNIYLQFLKMDNSLFLSFFVHQRFSSVDFLAIGTLDFRLRFYPESSLLAGQYFTLPHVTCSSRCHSFVADLFPTRRWLVTKSSPVDRFWLSAHLTTPPVCFLWYLPTILPLPAVSGGLCSPLPGLLFHFNDINMKKQKKYVNIKKIHAWGSE